MSIHVQAAENLNQGSELDEATTPPDAASQDSQASSAPAAESTASESEQANSSADGGELPKLRTPAKQILTQSIEH